MSKVQVSAFSIDGYGAGPWHSPPSCGGDERCGLQKPAAASTPVLAPI